MRLERKKERERRRRGILEDKREGDKNGEEEGRILPPVGSCLWILQTFLKAAPR